MATITSESQRIPSALEKCIAVAQNMKATYEQSNISRYLQVPPPTPVPSLDLSLPESITHKISSDLPKILIEKISAQVKNDVDNGRKIYQARFEDTCRELLSTPRHPKDISLSVIFSQLQQHYQTMFRRRLPPIIEAKITRAQEKWRADVSSRKTEKRKQAFNREYIPLLEKYFEYNAYPSPPDRAALARKCMMTQRQIEVWFQNHRNRAKKDGKSLRRQQNQLIPDNISLDSLKKQMPLFAVSEPTHLPTPDADDADESSSDNDVEVVPSISSADINNPLDIPAPLHAYPRRLKVECRYEPFPRNEHGDCVFLSPPLTWMRKPAAKLTPSAPVDFDDLIETFTTKLHLRMPSKTRKERQTTQLSTAPNSWYMSRITIPSPAPHPALIRNFRPISRPQHISSRATKYQRAFISLPNRVPSSGRPNAAPSMSSGGHWNPSSRSTSTTSSCTDRSFSSSSSPSCSSTLSTPSSSPSFGPSPLEKCADEILFTSFASQPFFTYDDFLSPSLPGGGQFFTSQLVYV